MLKNARLVLIALAVLAAGCGASTDETAPPDTETTVVTTVTTQPPSEEPADNGDEAPASTETITIEGQQVPVAGTATVTVGGRVYDIVLYACMTQSDGALVAEGVLSEEEDGAYLSMAQFFIQPEGSTTTDGLGVHSVVLVDYLGNASWNAGASPFLGQVTAADSSIRDWTNNGTTASGSVSFINEWVSFVKDDQGNYPVPESTEGQFEVRCTG